MINLIRADLYKMRKSSTIKILFGITTLCSLVMTYMTYMIQQGKMSEQYAGMAFLFSDVNITSILGAVLAGVYICGDFDNKTIHDAISCGIKRGTVLISKTIVYLCGIVFILLPYAIVTAIAISTDYSYNAGAVALGFLNILTKDYGITFNGAMVVKIIAVMLTLIIVYLSQLSICVPIAIGLKKPVLVVAIFYGISILSGQLSSLKNSSKVFDFIFACTPFDGKYGLVTTETAPSDLLKAVVVSVLFSIAMLAITYSTFRKSEIK